MSESLQRALTNETESDELDGSGVAADRLFSPKITQLREEHYTAAGCTPDIDGKTTELDADIAALRRIGSSHSIHSLHSPSLVKAMASPPPENAVRLTFP